MDSFDVAGKRVVIVGGGPAGLTAAYDLCRAGVPAVVLEQDAVVGGLSRTVQYKGYHFDIGGHRFFTKVKAVEDMWREVLPEGQLLRRPRLSRIYYNKKFFHYPLRATNALVGLGLWNSFMILVSYAAARVSPEKSEATFEQWVTNRFGRRLYETFFKTYTEKVWGIPCSEIMAEWAAQRIKGLSLLSAVKNALIKQSPSSKQDVIKTLIDEFEYPERGPGMMWERVAEIIQLKGARLELESPVQAIHWTGGRVTSVDIDRQGRRESIEGTDFISSMPIQELIQKLDPAPPAEVCAAARDLHYRDFLTVALVVNQPDMFPDNWIYIHDPEVKVGRIQNFKNWSPRMVPDLGKTCLGLEYFCFEGDGLWTMRDADLIALGTRELESLGLARGGDIEDGAVVRMPKAYPVYDGGYARAVATIRDFLDSIENLQLVGRNGMHKYNNQDHSMLTAMLAVKNILGGQYDLWRVNVEQEYHEEDVSGPRPGLDDEFAELAATQPRVPRRIGDGR
jgi:protoporphyrinogen oxidase